MADPLFRSDASRLHDTSAMPEVPERIARIEAIEGLLGARDWCGYEPLDSPVAADGLLELVHDPAYVSRIEQACATGEALDPETPTVPATMEAARHAAGGAAAMVDALLGGEAVGASLHRPPGHHAGRASASGFCLFNNVAIAAAHARAAHGIERVLVVDWDVHHGNGTEAIFWEDPRVCFVSIHQSPLWPGSGALADAGSGEGEGLTVNLPVPPGSGNEVWEALVAHVVEPVADAWSPGLVLVSAGFDAHRADPLAECMVDEAGFAAMARRIGSTGRRLGVPVGVVLEGGYDVDALAASVAATLEAVREEPEGEAPAPEPVSRMAAEVLGRPAFSRG
ncbi:MAG: histone deacetylase family protein [Solirubrobacterales bacterium]